MTNRIELINNLDSLLKECFNTIDNLKTYQRIVENDARVTFFKHLVNVIDSTILFFVVSHKHLPNEGWWKDIQKEYDLSTRPIPFVKEFDYYDQVVTYSFLLLIFSSFEASIRLIVKRYDSNLYQTQKDFSPLSKGLISKLKLNNKDKFIDLITTIRNSIHNNGLYVPRGPTKNKKIVWDNTIFHFDENRPISINELWPHLIVFSREICKIFTDIINTDEIKKIGYYNDPTE